MNTMTISDIHKRLRGLKEHAIQENSTIVCMENAAHSIKNGSPKDIMRSIEMISHRSNPILFESVLDLFDKLYECGTTGQLVKMCTYICEEAAPKVRNAKDTNTNLKRKLGRLKSKVTTRIDNNISNAKDEIDKKVSAVKGNFKRNTDQIKKNVRTGLGIEKKTKTEAYIECYERIIETLDKFDECDRILENYNSFSKRYNLDRIIIENTRVNGVRDTVNSICALVDTYDMPNKVKFNVAIESAWLGFEQSGIEFSKKDILEAAFDYFCVKENGYEDCKFALKNTTLFNPEDYPDDIEVITEEEPEDDNSILSMQKNIMDQLSGTNEASMLIEGTDFNKIFSDFKKQNNDKKENMLMGLVRKLYTKNVSNIVDSTPNFLNWIRLVLILGTVALNPVLGAVVAIGDIFVRLHFERDETEKMIKCFDAEIKKSETKMKSSKNEEEKRRLREYIASLKKARSKIDEYYDKMLTDKELDAKFDSDADKDSFDDIKADIKDGEDDDEFDLDFDDDDWDDSFDEAAVDTIDTVSTLVGELPDLENLGLQSIINIEYFNADDLDSLAKLSVQYPDVWAPELLESAIDGRITKIRKGKIVFENALVRFRYLNAYEEAKKTLHTYKPEPISTIGECKEDLARLYECAMAVDTILTTNKNKSLMVEASFMNTLKLASEKLKKGIQKLSDKDKTISRNVDVSLSQFRKGMENALTNENREAVIKGSILPSSSKIIKLAITTGALWLVNPAVAVIAALGYLGVSAKHKAKERALILDELDVELKMCEKYIDIAESKNDMKSLKQLLTIQKNLKRQEQRLRYKMKVDFNQNPTKTDND